MVGGERLLITHDSSLMTHHNPMSAKTLMIQGTASHVGKSVLTAALCRIFARRGMRVAPFKAQNMSNNSFVTPDGKEIGRAQAVQAAACRLSPRSEFNPVLIKPTGERSAQVVVNGIVAGELSTDDFGLVRRDYWDQARAAFRTLADEFDLIILEGAGSPAEINLRHHDIVNMAMAKEARAPVLLMGDIDRGGVFASLIGTLTLLEPDERTHVKGFVINKFRGDQDLLLPGLTMLQDRTGIPCLGILPHWEKLHVPEEDSLDWDSWQLTSPSAPDGQSRTTGVQSLTVGVADLPYLSNFTDLDGLAREPDVRLVRVAGPTPEHFDAMILPGTKSTAQALRFIRTRGIDDVVTRVLAEGGVIVGLCGGYQMLGERIQDPYQVESSNSEVKGLGLLDAVTTFGRRKVTVQVTGVHRASGCHVEGYEVHMGRTETAAVPLLDIRSAGEQESRPDGAVGQDGRILGSYVHGLFDGAVFRRVFLNGLRQSRGWVPLSHSHTGSLDSDLDDLANFVEDHLDIEAVDAVIQRGM